MALPDSQSRAPARSARIQNVPVSPGANKLPRKLIFVGTYDPAFTGLVEEELIRVFSANDVGAQTGFGYMLHRLVKAAAPQAGGLPMYIMPQAEAVAAVAAAGEILVTGTATEDGFIYLYIGDERIPIQVADEALAADIGDNVEAALSVLVNPELSLTGTNVAGAVATASKSKGLWGNFEKLSVNLGDGEETVAGITVALTQPVSGAGVPAMADALNALGTGDAQNEDHFTDGCDGYMMDDTSMDAISTYNGIADEDIGNFSPLVCRPFRWFHGDTAVGSAGLAALIVIADTRKLDRTNCVVPAPGSYAHPAELAAETMAAVALINNNDPAQSYLGKILSSSPGKIPNRWTDDYGSRDQAVKGGISTTFMENGVLTINKLVTFYRPDNVAVNNNGYRSVRNNSITQNILDNAKKYFDQDEWRQISIVKDSTLVIGTAKDKVRDEDAVEAALTSLADAFGREAWLYDAEYTKENLSSTVREAGNGFDNVFPVIYSAEGDIIDTQVNFDIALTVFSL